MDEEKYFDKFKFDYKFKTKPYAHQKSALEKSWHKDDFAYFMEMGTGKSKVLVDNIAMLYNKGAIDAALIIAPKGVYRNWYSQEIPNHLAGHIDHKTILWTATTSKAKDKEYQQLFKPDLDLHILIMNVEAFSTKKGLEFATKFLSCHKTLMAVDESTTIKTPTAKRTKAIINLGKFAKYRRILTGSPITKSPLDLYTQCAFLNDNLLGFMSYYSFRNRYAVMRQANFGGRRVQIVGGYKRLDELSDSLKKFSYRVLKEDCLDLPDKVYIKREIQLTTEQKKLYDQMKREALATLNGKTVTTMTALTQLMRLHQITCGHFSADDGSIQEIKNNRLAELLDVLEEIEGKAIIWAHYQHDVMNIYKLLQDKYGPGSVVHYYGKTLPEERDYAIKNFKTNDKVKFLIA